MSDWGDKCEGIQEIEETLVPLLEERDALIAETAKREAYDSFWPKCIEAEEIAFPDPYTRCRIVGKCTYESCPLLKEKG